MEIHSGYFTAGSDCQAAGVFLSIPLLSFREGAYDGRNQSFRVAEMDTETQKESYEQVFVGESCRRKRELSRLNNINIS